MKSWNDILNQEKEKPYFKTLQDFVDNEYEKGICYPQKENIFNALKSTPIDKVKVIILGQDPYINKKQAHGLAFSFANNHKANDSIKNIFKKIKNDININNSDTNLTCWRKRGVLLLNTALTYAKFENKENKNKTEN